MAKQVYARLDDDRIDQLDAKCEERDVYRPQIVTEAVELYLDTEGDPKQKIAELREERDSAQNQRNKFKEKFEQAVQTNEVLIARIQELQKQGVFKRASGLKRINTASYTISGGSE